MAIYYRTPMHGDPECSGPTRGVISVELVPDGEERARLLSIDETARVLRLSRREVNNLIARQELTGVHSGTRHLVVVASLDAYVGRLIEAERERHAKGLDKAGDALRRLAGVA